MALAKKPKERFGSASQLAAALEHHAESLGGLASEREVGLLVRELFPREFKSGPAIDAVELRTSGELESGELESIELMPVPAKKQKRQAVPDGPVNEPRNTARPGPVNNAQPSPGGGERSKAADRSDLPSATSGVTPPPSEIEEPKPEPRAPGGPREFDLEKEDAGYGQIAALFGESPGVEPKAEPPAAASGPVSMSDPSAVSGAAAAAQVYRSKGRASATPARHRRVRRVARHESPRGPRPLLFVLLALFVCSALFIVVSYWHRSSGTLFGEKTVVISDNPLLQEQGGRILIASSPPGAVIRLNGDPVGDTPASLMGLSAGSYRVVVRAPGFAPWSQQVEVGTGDTLAITARLIPRAGGEPGLWGTVNLTTAPQATVFVGGDRLGVTPLEGAKVPAGRTSLEFRLRNGRRLIRRIFVKPGQVVTKEISFK